MARAYPQSQPIDDDHDHSPAEWQSLKRELMVLLDQVDNQVTRARAPNEPRQRYAEPDTDSRHRDALRSVQRAITLFKDPVPGQTMPPNPRDSLQAAINQIRASQGQPQRRAAPTPPPMFSQPARATDVAPLFDKLAQSVNSM